MTLHLCCHQISLQLHLRKERSAVEILNIPKSLPNAVSIHKNKNMDWNHISGDSQNGSLNFYGFNHNSHSDLKCDIVLSQITAIPLYIHKRPWTALPVLIKLYCKKSLKILSALKFRQTASRCVLKSQLHLGPPQRL